MNLDQASTWIVLCVGLSTWGTASLAAADAPPAAPDGKTVFVEQKCTKCHSAPGIKGGKKDLSGVGAKHTPDWMKKWLKKEEALEGKKHKKAFSGSPAELDAVVKWLASLK